MSRELTAASSLVVRVARDNFQACEGAGVSVDDGKGRCPKLVFEGSVADSAGRAGSDGCNDGVKIRWKGDFLDGPRGRSWKGIECLRKRQQMSGNRVRSWSKSKGQKSSLLSLKGDGCSLDINQKRENGAAMMTEAVQGLSVAGRYMAEASPVTAQWGQRGVAPRESISRARFCRSGRQEGTKKLDKNLRSKPVTMTSSA